MKPPNPACSVRNGRLESDESRSWLEATRSRTVMHFGDIADIRVGIKTTADNVFIREDWDELRPEAELLRPLLTHHVAARWRVGRTTTTRVLYPHATDAARASR